MPYQDRVPSLVVLENDGSATIVLAETTPELSQINEPTHSIPLLSTQTDGSQLLGAWYDGTSSTGFHSLSYPSKPMEVGRSSGTPGR